MEGRFPDHCKVWRICGVSCAKTRERIEMLFGVLTRVGPRNMHNMGLVSPMGRVILGVHRQTESIGNVYRLVSSKRDHLVINDLCECPSKEVPVVGGKKTTAHSASK